MNKEKIRNIIVVILVTILFFTNIISLFDG